MCQDAAVLNHPRHLNISLAFNEECRLPAALQAALAFLLAQSGEVERLADAGPCENRRIICPGAYARQV